MKEILEQSTLRLPLGWRIALWVLVALGVMMFVIGLTTGEAERTWQAFLVNTMFWGGMAFGGSPLMAPWPTLSEADVENVIAFLRTLQQ